MIKLDDITRCIYDACNKIEEYKSQLAEYKYDSDPFDPELYDYDEVQDFLTDLYDDLFEYTNKIEEYFDLL